MHASRENLVLSKLNHTVGRVGVPDSFHFQAVSGGGCYYQKLALRRILESKKGNELCS